MISASAVENGAAVAVYSIPVDIIPKVERFAKSWRRSKSTRFGRAQPFEILFIPNQDTKAFFGSGIPSLDRSRYPSYVLTDIIDLSGH